MIYNLSARLKQLRQEKHLKQEQVALLVGVTKSAVRMKATQILM